MRKMATFEGYERPDGSVGIRNYVTIIPTVACANGVADMIVRAVPEAVSLYHCHGCGRAAEIAMHTNTLVGLGRNPNVAAVLVIGLGCETIHAEGLVLSISETGKPVQVLSIQDEGGSQKTAARGIEIVRKLIDDAKAIERKTFGFDRLCVGIECGGSDAFSGVTANPGVGIVADRIVDDGGTVILTETTEMIGTAHILAKRAASPEVASEIRRVIGAAEKRVDEILGPLASLVIAPGNMDGGMSSIREKSLGCIIKGGSRTINEVIDYGTMPSKKGLIIMDGPGYDMESLAGLGATGAQLILFTTGRGTPAGFPIVPVIKVASTSRFYRRMEDDIDINAGAVLEGKSLEDVAEEIIGLTKEVAKGRQTKAEVNDRGGVICLYSMNPAF